MSHVIVLFIGIAVGAVPLIAFGWNLWTRLKSQRTDQDAREKRLAAAEQSAQAWRQNLDREQAGLTTKVSNFDARVIRYEELGRENQLLKRELRNIDVDLRKLQLDGEIRATKQTSQDERANQLGQRYLKENVKWIARGVTPNNYANCKQRLTDVIARCRGIGLDIDANQEAELLAELKQEFEKAVKAAFEREEQSRIKAQIREEQRLEREIERERQQSEREQTAIQAALDRALAEAHDQHSEEVERLRARLAEAEARTERTKSMAQMTKTGNVYVISNIGSFGQDVFKVGMTRRLEPQDRVRELGDASVPFPFDVHMMIRSSDAPKLENALHRALHRHRLNKANPRKEFFRADIDTILNLVREHHGEVEYVADVEALEYHQSLDMSNEDMEVIEHAYEAAGADEDSSDE